MLYNYVLMYIPHSANAWWRQISDQQALVSKTLADFCLFVLFIVYTCIITLEGKIWSITNNPPNLPKLSSA